MSAPQAALLEALKRVKVDLERQRRFNTDDLAGWRRACTSAESDIEEILNSAALASAEAQPARVECDACPTSGGCRGKCMKAAAEAQPAPAKTALARLWREVNGGNRWPSDVDAFVDAMLASAPAAPAQVRPVCYANPLIAGPDDSDEAEGWTARVSRNQTAIFSMPLHAAPADAVTAELLAALKAIEPFIPTTSASEGGAARHSANVRAADMVRAAIAKYEAAK